MKKTKKTTNGTSFHDSIIRASINQLNDCLWQGTFYGFDDKVSWEWECELENGKVFTIYDWKEYRKLGKDELVNWHIGGVNRMVTQQAYSEIIKALTE
jgi:hypothetical protein